MIIPTNVLSGRQIKRIERDIAESNTKTDHKLLIKNPHINPTTIIILGRFNARREFDITSIEQVMKLVSETIINLCFASKTTASLSVNNPSKKLEKTDTIIPREIVTELR